MASNVEQQTATTSDVYSRLADHPAENIKLVCRLEDEEQQRRIMDTFGEQLKRSAASQVSDIITNSLRPGWFQKGSAYVLHLLRVARNTGSDVLSSSQLRALSAKIQIAGDKGINQVMSLKHSFEITGEAATIAALNAKFKVQETLSDAIVKAQASSQDARVKVLTASETVKTTSFDVVEKLQSTSHDVKLKLQETFATAQEKIQDRAEKIRKAGLELLGKALSVFMQLLERARTANTLITYSVSEEDSERLRRMNSETEATAIANAYAVSSLIKELGPDFYRPTSEPSSTFTTQMMEDIERKRRIQQDSTDKTAADNARAVSTLVKNYTTPTTTVVEAILPAKVEFIEPIKLHAPMGASM